MWWCHAYCPIPLYAAVDNRMDIMEADKWAGDAAEITHQHPLGYIPASLMSHVIYRLVLDENPTREGLIEYIYMRELGNLTICFRSIIGKFWR